MSTAPSAPLFGQPRGLAVLFLTQMWETFSYYGMRALLVYYMTQQLLFGQQKASLVYGVYTAMVFFTPILGGILSDRWLGRRRAVLIGGSVMALGHFLLASETLFFPALACIALGNGLFLPSLPAQIDALYPPGDSRRFSAYNVYYLGINLGGLLAPLVCGALGEIYGWHYGFGAAGLGMLAGLAIYVAGGRHLPDAMPVAVAPVVPLATADGDLALRAKLRLLLGVGLCVVLFRAAYEQVGNTIALWAASGIDRQVADSQIPMAWFQALNPLFVILFTPLLLAWWATREKRGQVARPVRRMAAGALGVALAYALLAAVAGSAQGSTHWTWLVGFFLLLTIGELFILPVGLGLFARLAPDRHRATTVAAWFFAAFGGNLLAGVLGMAWTPMGPAGFFTLVAAVAGLSALLLRCLDPAVERVARHEPGLSGAQAVHP
ncbi:MAG: peptide ABC transporter [Lysobacterales bacterium GWF1_69_6]|nr:MAG: peptide ABC transporter [Xanthomonadales bacterium GWF1_69_6]